MKVNVRHGFNRLFIVLTAAWVVYCLLVYPLQQGQRAVRRQAAIFQECYQNTPNFKACSQYAVAISGVNDWSLKSYYERESWFLGLLVVTVPLLVYGLCRGAGVLSVWIWRGFVSSNHNT